MKIFNRFPLFCVLLHAFQATDRIQFISPYSSKNITAFIGDSVQFTWSYSGGTSLIKSITCEAIDPNGILVSVNTKTGQNPLGGDLPVGYNGRVSWTFSGDQSSGQLNFTLAPLKNDDDRFYRCMLDPVSSYDTQVFDYVYLVVQGPPNITDISPNITVKECDTVILMCSAQGNPPATITWTKDKRVVNVPLRNISREAAGSYRCTAVNGVGSPATADVFITVQYKPTIKSVVPLLVTQSWIGERVSLQCEADGVPLPNITWKKPDESPLNSVQAAKRTIEVLMQSDADFGNYTCEAANLVGADTRKVYVKQLKAPGSPNISVTTEATSLTVTWLPPIYNGGSTVTGYQVHVINGTHGILITNSTTSPRDRMLEIPNLKKNTEYTVRVYARNKVSFGEAAEILAKTKFVGPPTAVTTNCKIQDDNVSVSITWKQPASNGADITEYTVYQRRRNEQEWMVIKTIGNTSSLEFVVKELEKGKEYEFLITARNTYGESVQKGYCKRVQVPGDVPEAVNTTCSIKKSKVILTWKPPASNGAVIKRYKVYQKGQNKEQWTEIERINNASHEYVVSEVEKGGEYDFVVTATNDYGDSPKVGGCKGVKLPEDSLPTIKAQTGGLNTVVVAGAAVAGVLLVVGVVVFGIWWKRRKSSRDDPSSSAAALRSDNHYEPDDGYQDVSASAAARGLQAEAGPVAEPDYAQVDVSKKKRNRRPVTDEYAQVDKSKKSKKPRKQPGELDYAELDDFRPSVQPAAAAEAAPARPLIRRPAYEGTEYADITQFGVPQPEPTYGNVPKKDVVYSNVQGI